MNDVLIATQEQAIAAIHAHIAAPGVDPVLTALVNGVLAVHRIDPPEDGGVPWADCPECGGSGVVVHISEDGVNTRHCHCQCPWCAGCDEALCAGPCPTVVAIARALGLIGDQAKSAAATCCDLHNQHCEPPADLCCAHCTEASHPDHRPGESCVLAARPKP